MLMKCTVQMDGPGPFEKIVAVETANGTLEVIVDVDQVHDSLLNVESVYRRNGQTLVELPRESTTGQTRVWVPTDSIIHENAA
jgi:hypothetical protein